jgi:hypothetical protein
MGNRNQNSTDYVHADEPNILNVHKAMDYNQQGQPLLRTTGSSYDWIINISAGAVDGTSYIEKFGMNLDVDSDKETIWDGGDIYEYIETAETVELSSTSPQDNPTGSGARTVEVQGLNAAGEVVEETINMGATSTTEFKRVFRAIVHVAGASGLNEGTISITSSDTSTLLAQIGVDGTGSHAAGRGQTFMALYTVPAGKTAYLTQWTVGAGKQNTDAVAFLMVRDPDAVGNGAWQSKDVITVSATTYSKDYKVPLKVKAGDDIEVRAYSTTNNSLVSSTFNLILIDNPV